MYNKNLLYVLTMLEAIEKILIYTKSFNSADDFYNSEDQKNFKII